MGWGLVLPATLLIGVFVIWPTINMAIISVHGRATLNDVWTTPVGFANYEDLLTHDRFRQSLLNTFLFALLIVPAQTALAMLLAVWANGPGWTRRFLRIAVFIPTALSLAVLSVIWKLMYEPASETGAGLLNGMLQTLGLPTQPFLTSPDQALAAIAVMSIWQGVGLQMMVYLSGLQSIPAQLYEAATLDGAGPWQRFRHITVPSLAPTTVFVVLVTTIFALRLFVQPHLMTGGGPQDATLSVVQYMYEQFSQRDLTLSCAAGTVFLVVVLALTLALRRLMRALEVTA